MGQLSPPPCKSQCDFKDSEKAPLPNKDGHVFRPMSGLLLTFIFHERTLSRRPHSKQESSQVNLSALTANPI